ncbi:MAG: hypothetical protein RQ936_10775 [Gammaproteobacteria bacterium]|nr:hypothetical protein [Gammaproteobacteria bacterium]
MKHSLTAFFSLVALLLNSSTALAHTGHLHNQTVHGFLHAEHLLVLAALVIVGSWQLAVKN